MAKKRGPTWEPKWVDYQRAFQEQNPWHSSGEVPTAWAMRVERPMARYLPKRLLVDEPRRYQLIVGPRRVGKTTSMYQAVKHLLADGVPARLLWWLRLDHPLLTRMPLGELVRYLVSTGGASEDRPLYLFLDEITYADQWDLWLKTFYDEKWPIRVAGTSSATAALRERRLESGVGRWEEQYMAPYLFSEYLELIDRGVRIPVGETLSKTIDSCIAEGIQVGGLETHRRKFLLMGGFPELLIASRDAPEDDASLLLQSQRTLRNDAVERAVYKDIPQAFNVDDPMLLERVLYTLAGQLAGLLSPQSICQELGGLSQPTFNRYLGYLERAFLVFTLANFSENEAARQRRGRKLYFVDAAIRNAALQRGLAPLTDYGEMGLLVENMVAGHIKALGEVGQVRLFHWRDGTDEVDLVYDHPQSPLAFEIGMGHSHHHRGLNIFQSKFPRFRGRCYMVGPTATPTRPEDTRDHVGTLPLDLLLLAVGVQADQELAKRLA